MTYVKINDRQIAATINGTHSDRSWDGRDSKTIRCAMTYEEAVELFPNDADWSILYVPEPYEDENGETVIPETEIYDNSEYCVSGPITDNRDGTVSVKMGKPTDAELLAIIMGG